MSFSTSPRTLTIPASPITLLDTCVYCNNANYAAACDGIARTTYCRYHTPTRRPLTRTHRMAHRMH